MKMGFREEPSPYRGATQTARYWSEDWIATHLYCLACGAERLAAMPNNQPVADFRCAACSEEYELKAQTKKIADRVVDGAYRTMIERLAAQNNPNLVLMAYSRAERSVQSVTVVPRHFFTTSIIEERKPLATTARRAGWVGCNILVGRVPEAGKIFVVRDGKPVEKDQVLKAWRRTLFLRSEVPETRGWLIETLKCVERIGREEFALSDLYAFEEQVRAVFPGNNFVREKMRQQLQVLRDRGVIEFLGRGKYRVKPTPQ